MPGRELYQLDFGDHHCTSRHYCYVRSSRIPKPLPARILATQLELVIPQPFEVSPLGKNPSSIQLRGDQSGPFPMKSWRQEQVNGKKVAIDIGERCESFSQISFCKALVPVTQPSTRCVVSDVQIVLRCQLASAQ